MSSDWLVDTGPIVALLNSRDEFHHWATERFSAISPPVKTCEAVLSEACFLVRDLPGGPSSVLSLVERNLIKVSFDAGAEARALRSLMERYANVPMAFADACLVRMSEQDRATRILTIDAGFRIFRRNGRHVIPVALPPGR